MIKSFVIAATALTAGLTAIAGPAAAQDRWDWSAGDRPLHGSAARPGLSP